MTHSMAARTRLASLASAIAPSARRVVTYDGADAAGVGLVTFRNPPVNALSLQFRDDLAAALDASATDPACKAVVCVGQGQVCRSPSKPLDGRG